MIMLSVEFFFVRKKKLFYVFEPCFAYLCKNMIFYDKGTCRGHFILPVLRCPQQAIFNIFFGGY